MVRLLYVGVQYLSTFNFTLVFSQASGSGLWLDCHTEEDLFLIVKKWLMTLEKQGCASMLQAGKK